MTEFVYYIEYTDRAGNTHKYGTGRRRKVSPFVSLSNAKAQLNKMKKNNDWKVNLGSGSAEIKTYALIPVVPVVEHKTVESFQSALHHEMAVAKYGSLGNTPFAVDDGNEHAV